MSAPRKPDILRLGSGGDAAVICFTGYVPNMAVSEDFYEFHGSMEVLRQEYPHIDAYLIRDRYNRWFHGGSPAIEGGALGLASFLADVRQRYRHIVFVGNSMGAYAALHYGWRSGADLIVAISPQTAIDATSRTQIGDLRWPEEMRAVQEEYGDASLDLNDPLVAGDASASTIVFYGGQDWLDISHAERILHPEHCWSGWTTAITNFRAPICVIAVYPMH